ncbi:hypothetical protein Ancab_011458 [Ancistrocladus abbreviatus]
MEVPISGQASSSGWEGISGRKSFSLEPNGNMAMFHIHDSSKSIAGVKARFLRNCMPRRRFSLVGFLKSLGNSITTAYRTTSIKKESSSKESFSARKSVDSMDDHVSEAIKDCVEYIHSCSAPKG